MDERAGGDALGGFLPPEPGGPEPKLGPEGGEAQAAPDHHGFLPPEHAQTQRYASPPQSVQPPARDAWLGGAGAGPQQQPAHWAGYPAPSVPDNGDALAGIILSVSAATLLLLSVGMSTIISVVCAGLGIYYSRKGRARVERGETPKHRGVAQAGFVTGVVTLVLSILMTIIWVTVAILYASDEDFRQDLEDELDGDESSPDGFETSIRVAVTALRLIALLLR